MIEYDPEDVEVPVVVDECLARSTRAASRAPSLRVDGLLGGGMVDAGAGAQEVDDASGLLGLRERREVVEGEVAHGLLEVDGLARNGDAVEGAEDALAHGVTPETALDVSPGDDDVIGLKLETQL